MDPSSGERWSRRRVWIASAGVAGIVVLALAGWYAHGLPGRRAAELQAGAPVPAAEADRGAAPSGKGAPASPAGSVEVSISDVILSAPAKIQAEKFKCVCGCNMTLAECNCQKTPGGLEMKQFLQSLVDRGLSPADIERAMVEKYGPAVIR